MIEVTYTNGIKEKRECVHGDEMHDSNIKDVMVFGSCMRTHTGRLLITRS